MGEGCIRDRQHINYGDGIAFPLRGRDTSTIDRILGVVAIGSSSPFGGGIHPLSVESGYSNGIVFPLWGRDTSVINDMYGA
jgi:hypothetical protein